MNIFHHGAVKGVTGSCHELRYKYKQEPCGILIDCGLFQGEDADGYSQAAPIPFEIAHIKALVVTHVHIDHVGRIPNLLAKGFSGPIYCSEASAHLLPLVLEDALKVGFTKNQQLIERVIDKIRSQIVAVAYHTWQAIDESLRIQFSPAGHILGSAYITCELESKTIIFSGDLGAQNSPLLNDLVSPKQCDELIIESTYGDKNHENREQRQQRLQAAIEHALEDGGTVLIPAFSIGRTQELLYELEDILYNSQLKVEGSQLTPNNSKLNIIVDSPLAAKFTQSYRKLKHLWDNEAQQKLVNGRHPLNFEQLTTIDDHETHLQTVKYLANTKQPAIVIAASGMCNGGRIMNYLEAMLNEKRHDVLFVGYQASGTIGRIIQKYGPKNGHVTIGDKTITINAQVHTISGYSAHADKQDLLRFVAGIKQKPKQIRIVHGDNNAKRELRNQLKRDYPEISVIIPTE